MSANRRRGDFLLFGRGMARLDLSRLNKCSRGVTLKRGFPVPRTNLPAGMGILQRQDPEANPILPLTKPPGCDKFII